MKHDSTILIVDDDPGAHDTLEALLFREDYDLACVTSGQEALACLDKLAPDVILLDVMMPGMDGFQVCHRLKADERWRHIPVIMVTALDSKADLVRGLDAGADDLVSKPVNSVELRARVRSMLRIKGLYDALGKQLGILEILHSAGLRMMRHLDMDSIVALISKTALELVSEAAGCILHFLANYEQRLLSFALVFEDSSKEVHSNVGTEEIIWQVIENGMAVYVPDATTDPRHLQPRLPEMRSLLSVPLTDDQDLRGVLTVYSPKVDAFEEDHQVVLSILASQVTVAMIKVRFFEEVELAKEREKRAIRNLFQRYVSPAVVDRLVDGVEDLTLGGKRQEISVLFADIRGFTSYSENLAPEHLVEILNQYLALAVEAILAQEGTLDKFVGDAVMALFNAPLPQPDHALRAVRAALAMQQAIADYNVEGADHAPLSFGVGIHVGQAVVGNVGTVQQMNYTAIGDTVNLAKRLQEHASGGQIILSRAVYEAVKDKVTVEDLGPIMVKGRAAAEHAYSLTGLTGNGHD